MSDIVLSVSIPLDDSNFLRRECPHCIQEFKIQISEEELKNIATSGIQSYLTNDEIETSEEPIEENEAKYYCPYCGQEAPVTSWWTKEQLAYLQVYAKNIMAKMVNEHLIKPLNRNSNNSSGMVSISFKGEEMKYEEPWISEEVNDMSIIELPCCNKNIKILEEWTKNIFCFYCGFEHNK